MSEPRADRGALVLVRVYMEARLDTPPVQVTCTTRPPARERRRRALPPRGAQ